VFLVFSRKADAPEQVYHAAVYHDQTGEVWFKGPLKLASPPAIAPRFFRDPKFFSSWDGERLYLADGRHLSVMTPVPGEGG
jgi:hypothetical protein